MVALRHSCGLSKWTVKGKTKTGEKPREGGEGQVYSKQVSVGNVLKFTAHNKNSWRKHQLMQF